MVVHSTGDDDEAYIKKFLLFSVISHETATMPKTRLIILAKWIHRHARALHAGAGENLILNTQ